VKKITYKMVLVGKQVYWCCWGED